MWFLRTHRPKELQACPEAAKATQESKKALQRVEARTQEVREVAEASKRFRRENHFALDLQNVFGGQTT